MRRLPFHNLVCCLLISLFATSCIHFHHDNEDQEPATQPNSNQPSKSTIREYHNDPYSDVYTVCEEMPQFRDGDVSEYLKQHIRYPAAAVEQGIQGRVIVQFIVNRFGKVIDPQVVRGVDPSLNEEALRVVRNMPRWKPGRQRNQAVNVKYTLPIPFWLK
ncbi:energy transducer TonB [Paludibacter jiangxiensis]|uniref:TonB family C-terminal domain-containing protein n=1 Tax=Paludibacter jiangxiensis TaxID=681398 RepID=A0A161M6G0_9BACT|nr:energy transducer TonB [Paludibacter jiangxiensis]GAT64243.1 TonB family C-terminal domain-containing protein [Paludibacter jiangxiensis]